MPKNDVEIFRLAWFTFFVSSQKNPQKTHTPRIDRRKLHSCMRVTKQCKNATGKSLPNSENMTYSSSFERIKPLIVTDILVVEGLFQHELPLHIFSVNLHKLVHHIILLTLLAISKAQRFMMFVIFTLAAKTCSDRLSGC